jgi:hypothetical protein
MVANLLITTPSEGADGILVNTVGTAHKTGSLNPQICGEYECMKRTLTLELELRAPLDSVLIVGWGLNFVPAQESMFCPD